MVTNIMSQRPITQLTLGYIIYESMRTIFNRKKIIALLTEPPYFYQFNFKNKVMFEKISFQKIFNAIRDNKVILSSPLSGSSKLLFVKELFKEKKQIILLFPDAQAVSESFVELSIIGLGEETVCVTELKAEVLQEKLTGITEKEKFILLSTYELLTIPLPSKKEIKSNTTKIQTGGETGYNELVEYLNLLHYQKDKFVGAPGEFAQRGSIIDLWSYSEGLPCRIEFDGDFIESIRTFDPDSQRSINAVEFVSIAAPVIRNINDETNFSTNGLNESLFEYLENPIFIVTDYEMRIRFGDDYLDHSQLKQNNSQWFIDEEIGSNEDKIQSGFTEAPSINGNFDVLFNSLRNYTNDGYRVYITAENEVQSSRLSDLLYDFRDELAELVKAGKVIVKPFAIKSGFIFKPAKIMVLTDYQIFNKPYRTRLISEKKKKSIAKEFASIKRGDFVVHEDYGIGQYVGLESIRIGETMQETMKIIYDEGGIVYVNLNYLNLVKKYSSQDNSTPRLALLGSAEWSNTKQRMKKKIKEAARNLIELYAKRKASKGYGFSADTVWQKELEASFLYEDTPDQTKVTEEIKADMEAENPMDRLVCGDVGFGKTEVAVRAAFKSVQDGKQVAILVPTTILAEQHHNTFKDRFTQFPVKVEVLSRFQSKKKQTEIIKELTSGIVDVVIGTHRLLSKDVSFKDLGLLIIDEEHRFGVMAKEKLRELKNAVDTLTLTATPIPRTLNLSLLGARDLSLISTPPPNRQPIYTHVSTFDIIKIRELILNEVKRNGQVYFVHDRVQSIDKFAAYITKHIPEVSIAIAHGQMKPAQLENVIHGFLNRKYDVLLSTKIIESGLDIPNVNTIIVNRADRFGLAELHQLRGRVGRSNRQAFAYFLVPSLSAITKKAIRRLQAIEEYTDIGAGFNLSMRDLEIRGAGNLLGTEQSGFIEAVGFDMYLKLLDEAVDELKQVEFREVFYNLPKVKERTDPNIDTYFEIGITKEYMPDQMDRLSFYASLFGINNINELKEIQEEMIDRFGTIPPMVNRLIASALLKFYASLALFERVVIQRKNIILLLPNGKKEEYYKDKFPVLMNFIMKKYKNRINFSQQKDVLKLVIPNNFEKPESTLEFLVMFCKEVNSLWENQVA